MLLFVLLLISAVWGLLSPKLFMEGWLAFLGIVATLIAQFQGKLERRNLVRNLFQFSTELVFFFTLLLAGFYLLYNHFALGRTNPEIIVYWVASTVQLAFLLATLSRRLDLLIERSQK